MNNGQMPDQGPAAEPDGFAAAVAAEIATLRAAGFSKAYICERSFEIEARVWGRLALDPTDHHPSSPYHSGED